MLFWYLTLPLRLVTSAFYWTMLRIGGRTRARMTSIELDNRMLWERNFQLEMRLANLESQEAERKQAVLIERVLEKIDPPNIVPGYGVRIKMPDKG